MPIASQTCSQSDNSALERTGHNYTTRGCLLGGQRSLRGTKVMYRVGWAGIRCTAEMLDHKTCLQTFRPVYWDEGKTCDRVD